MVYMALTAGIVIIAITIAVIAAKTLFKRSWLLGWLRGSGGLLLLLLAALMVLSALDIYSYRQYEKNKAIANVSFSELAPQHFKASLIGDDGVEHSYELRGDLWQLDVRLLTWSKTFARMGLLPGYRLDRLSGRYVSLEEEKFSPRTVHSLWQSDSGLDVWALLHEYGKNFSLLESSYGSATYLPMKDGALYAVKLTPNGLAASPLNDRAKQAIANWQ
ncbi:cation/multidrug efflux pump [Dasania sp. GY-MA-18]|uniref:Cation/multidrug efflux pump n=1 Tax=Dasania phycosphaerae TaxID=2950436 RepID=A0A9J6RIN6_9GAMM|nr:MULTISPECIES: cation/multidrug efflux pump [Dasania]MCR8921789.1 cation/multidrug efflux pump [Dasania sp. GY-MA-18]MCZ0864217.1 cation/multidrug efflux pump [Dasania phycosphaerae]MCZ0867945.1 cation/multidrug efflux pump [Dasania phycosphaerae]